ncbi:MAG: aromatic ring-hydroxylating dioxygenase subunit alpha [Gammaproteobacteria bacterium]|nr:aromatic ring-hydroxylating dioxygenase subunit alpha [Gammaproteobacteria bacterium]
MTERPDALSDSLLAASSLDQAWTLPGSWYTDPAVYRYELEHVFASAWQLIGHRNSLAKAGDFLVSDIAGAPVLAVRDRSDKIRAFYNVCRHRAGPVATGHGNCTLLRCRYHGWVYELDGSLRHAPEMDGTRNFDATTIGLEGLELGVTDSLLFVRNSGESALVADIARVVREINDRIGPQTLGSHRLYQRVSYDMRCNWKVYVDNYLEGYHIPQVHPELAEILDYRQYVTETFAGYSLQHSSIESATAAYSAGDAYYYFVFPNIMLNILPGRLQTNVVIPLGPDRCRVDFDYYYLETESAAAREQITEDLSFGDLVQQQDVAICQQVQTGLSSGSYERGRLSAKREAGVHHFQECLRSVFRNATQR